MIDTSRINNGVFPQLTEDDAVVVLITLTRCWHRVTRLPLTRSQCEGTILLLDEVWRLLKPSLTHLEELPSGSEVRQMYGDVEEMATSVRFLRGLVSMAAMPKGTM